MKIRKLIEQINAKVSIQLKSYLPPFILLSLCLSFLSNASSLSANDTVLQGTVGGDIVPLHDQRLTMESEDITMTFLDMHVVKIEAIYKFKNITSEKIKVDLGFPELPCNDKINKELSEDDADGIKSSIRSCSLKKSPQFRNFETCVKQEKVKHQIVSTKATQVRDVDIPEYNVVYSYPVSFEPNEEIEVKHQYQIVASESLVDFFTIEYLTKTGNFWAKPIGRASFKLIHHIPLVLIAFLPKEYLLKSVKQAYIKDRYNIEIEFEMKNWLPKEDLIIHIQALGSQSLEMLSSKYENLSCPRTPFDMNLYEKADIQSFLKDPNIESFLKDSNFDGDRVKEIQKCINLIYAYYGYPFKNKELRSIFYKDKAEYSKPLKLFNDCDDESCSRTFPLTEIPGFNEKSISFNLQLYIKYLKKLKEAL
jgi:hypothetical protein